MQTKYDYGNYEEALQELVKLLKAIRKRRGIKEPRNV